MMILNLAISFDMTPQAQAIKQKIDKLNYINIKKFCTPKDIVKKKVKDNLKNMRKYFQIKCHIRA